MPGHTFVQVDAFTDRPFAGNPCAVVFDADDMDERTMLAVAAEMNLAETAFVLRSDVAAFGLRFYTPAEEIPLAGHPTIAAAYALVDSGRLTLTGDRTTVYFELKEGPIRVDLRTDGAGPLEVVMSQREPEFLRKYEPEEVLPVFGLTQDDLLPGASIQTVSTGTPQLMVPLRSLEAVKKAKLEIDTYTRLRTVGDFFSPHLFCLGGISGVAQTFARHFGVPPDLPEDAFTGSATGGMAAYLWRYGLIPQPVFTAEQGHMMGRPGRAQVEVVGPPDKISTVKIGGSAVKVLWGELVV